ncbi:glycosyl hydrolase family 18 protein [Brevibacillus fulvus]|uniref:Spore germination protein YaaH n=1 Tax=Brevibacillus fulvus TaxID=1125967 RepID=A0A939BNZ2_9BACL|nr:glycosyl hydrolase family 18 protein [Brevibacillus fulvus]MBM7589830.1 spore germination protein YaaH [Brevibacillus fulvus]
MNVPLGMASRKRRKRSPRLYMVMILFLLLLAFIPICWWVVTQIPSGERVAPYEGRKQVIVFQGKPYEKPFAQENEQVLLPFDFIKEHLDPHIFWDEPSNSIIVTTKDKVLRMESEKVVAYLNRTPVDLSVPVKEIDGVRFVPFSPLEKLYPVTVRVTESGMLIVEQDGYSVQSGEVIADEDQPELMRLGPSIKQPIVAEQPAKAKVDILGERDNWYQVETSDGIVGYLPKESVRLQEIRKVTLPQTPEQAKAAPIKPLEGKVNLTWEQVSSRNPNLANIPAMPGLNVISPTWFELKDEQGTLSNKADPAYVEWAHKRGYQVWGLVSNGFNPDWTQAVLKDFRLREKLVGQILNYADLYNLDGINLDFENVYLEDKQNLVQFVRELTPYLHEQGLIVSMDVTIKSTSERWSLFYDRPALSQVVDYMIVMTYDEHAAASPEAGSVASLPWVEEGLRGVLAEIPNDKLILGMPYYTRLWKEEKQSDGTIKVSSKALTMETAEAWMKERNLKAQPDEQSGQLFVSYTDPQDGATYKMWLEEAGSIQKRVELVHKYALAGVASWRRGYEKSGIWETVQETLNKSGKP